MPDLFASWPTLVGGHVDAGDQLVSFDPVAARVPYDPMNCLIDMSAAPDRGIGGDQSGHPTLGQKHEEPLGVLPQDVPSLSSVDRDRLEGDKPLGADKIRGMIGSKDGKKGENKHNSDQHRQHLAPWL